MKDNLNIAGFAFDLEIASPGRINLIGEHTDYNDGYVLPAAIDKNIVLKFARNGSEKECRVQSIGFGEVLGINLDKVSKSDIDWENYILGVLNELLLRTDKVKGFDCLIESSVPVGSGVSSSAALECGLAFGLNELFDLGLEKWELIKLSQRAEHTFVGTQCGIMDQFSLVMGRKGHSMLLDCQKLDFEYIPTNIDPYVILLLNTNVKHNLATSGYNDRREESSSGLKIIAEHFGVPHSFRNITLEMVNECKEELGDIRYRRCSYVLEENQRVLKAAESLKKNDIVSLGKLLYESHEGQSKKYEVSCPELDFLVHFSKGREEVLGARMMGGGFGGCTLNIIHREVVETFVKETATAYKKEFSIELSSFQTVPSQGISIIKRYG